MCGVFNWGYIEPIDNVTLAKERTPRRYTGGKTLLVPCDSSSGLISIADCRTLLAIATRDTMNDYLKTLGLFGRDFLNWDEFQELLRIQAFLGLKHGYNSKQMYLLLRDQGNLQNLFANYGIDIEQRFRRIQGDYHKQQRQA